MAIPLNDNIRVIAPKPSDPRSLTVTNGLYASVDAANLAIPITERCLRLTVNLVDGEYWYKDGVADNQLILKSQDLSNINNHIANTNNPHAVTKAQVGLGNVPNLSFSGTNTGDETITSIQTKRPLKTIEGQSLEGVGNIDLSKSDVGLANVDNTSDLNKPISIATRNLLTNGDEFYIDLNDIFRLNVSTYRQVEIATQNNQTFTLDFEPTFIISVIKDGIYLLQNQYIYTTPNQLQVLENVIGETIEITYEKFINEPTVL